MNDASLTIERPALPKGRSYALKTSLLVKALAEASISCEVQLQYWTPQHGSSILQAFFWPASPRVPRDRVFIRAGSVASSDRRRALELLSDTGIPLFIGWLKAVLELSDKSPLRSEDLSFDAAICDGQLTWHAKPRPN